MEINKRRVWKLLVFIVMCVGFLAILFAATTYPLVTASNRFAAEPGRSKKIAATAIPQPFPIEPPDLSKIAVSIPDEEGYAIISGSDDAVPPEATYLSRNDCSQAVRSLASRKLPIASRIMHIM